ncbi:MAG: Swt1 family HEPN domain-containing protein [Vicinamibacterales bacterium]
MNDPEAVIRAGLQALVPHLRRFVLLHLEKNYGPDFWQQLSRPGERPFKDTDPRALIKAGISEWESVFRLHAPGQVKQYLHLLRDVANRHAHHESVNADEVSHALATMRLLAVAVAGDQASPEFDRLLFQLSPARAEGAGARQAVPRPPGATSRLTDGALDPDLLDAYSALNKAVLCPACRTKVFKAWPLGWDAHAAFACGGVTLSDPEDRKRDFRTRFARLFR